MRRQQHISPLRVNLLELDKRRLSVRIGLAEAHNHPALGCTVERFEVVTSPMARDPARALQTPPRRLGAMTGDFECNEARRENGSGCQRDQLHNAAPDVDMNS